MPGPRGPRSRVSTRPTIRVEASHPHRQLTSRKPTPGRRPGRARGHAFRRPGFPGSPLHVRYHPHVPNRRPTLRTITWVAFVLAVAYFSWRGVWRGVGDSEDLAVHYSAGLAWLLGHNPYDAGLLTKDLTEGGSAPKNNGHHSACHSIKILAGDTSAVHNRRDEVTRCGRGFVCRVLEHRHRVRRRVPSNRRRLAGWR